MKFFVTTAIDYTNDIIHIGHAYQKVVADALARYWRLRQAKVFFLTGTDEHGSKVEEAAHKAGFTNPKEFVDKIVAGNKKELAALLIEPDRFIRTTDLDHQKMVRRFWQKVAQKGDLYLATYKGIYCPGCEAYLTGKDLKDGRCPFHPHLKLKVLQEKNYFFRWSRYQRFLEEHFASHPEFVQPKSQRGEMLAFLKEGLRDIPVSRKNVRWGIPVPGDPQQTIYVWFDALINYLTGAPAGFWPADLHLLGKDNTRWHALLWPAMLRSAGYSLPKTIYAHGFLSLNGQKISKSLGNILRPSSLVARYSSDGARYLLLRFKPLWSDGDITLTKFDTMYNADLASDWGNLISRLVALLLQKKILLRVKPTSLTDPFWQPYHQAMEAINPYQALEWIHSEIAATNQIFNKEAPWRAEKMRAKKILSQIAQRVVNLATAFLPVMPKTSQQILDVFADGNFDKLRKPLFPRLS